LNITRLRRKEEGTAVCGRNDGRDGGNRSSGCSNGDGGNGGDNAAAMVAVTAAPTWRRQWHRGRLMWAEVIFRTYYYLHNSRVRMVQM